MQLLGSENLAPGAGLVGTGDDGKGGPNKDIVHCLEISVVTWTRQIKDVLKNDPDVPAKVRERVAGKGRE